MMLTQPDMLQTTHAACKIQLSSKKRGAKVLVLSKHGVPSLLFTPRNIKEVAGEFADAGVERVCVVANLINFSGLFPS